MGWAAVAVAMIAVTVGTLAASMRVAAAASASTVSPVTSVARRAAIVSPRATSLGIATTTHKKTYSRNYRSFSSRWLS